MALLLLRNEADCLVPDMKTELVSSRVPPELSRSPLPRERFRPAATRRHSSAPPLGHSEVRSKMLIGHSPSYQPRTSGIDTGDYVFSRPRAYQKTAHLD